MSGLFVTRAANLDHVSHAKHGVESFHIAIPQTDAAMRCRSPNRPRRVCSVDSIAFAVETEPARAYRVIFARAHHHSGVVIAGIGNFAYDFEAAFRAGTHLGS